MQTEDALAIDGGMPVRSEPLDFAKGSSLLGSEEADALAAVIAGRSLFRYKGGLETGTVAEFERAACEFLGCRYAVAVANGTAALRCALAALGVGCGDEVIMPAFTFVATVNAVVAAGAVPVFAEIDDTLGLDPSDLDEKITDRTAAIIAVHLENVACDLDALLAVAERRGIPMVEDTAQSFGATYRGRALGTFGALGTFSLQQEKNITAGEGGLVATDDETLYLRAARFQDQGGQFVTSYASTRGEELTESFAGENLRMGELAGAVAGVQLGRLPGILASLRSNKKRIVERVGEIDGLTRRRIPIPTVTDLRASPGSCPTRRSPSGSPPRCAPRAFRARRCTAGCPCISTTRCSRGAPRRRRAGRGRARSTRPTARTAPACARAPRSSRPVR